MGKNHLLELIFVVVVLFPCDSIFLEKFYVFVNIFLIAEKPQKALVRCCSTQLEGFLEHFRPSPGYFIVAEEKRSIFKPNQPVVLLFLIHGSNKSENQKEKTNSTLNSQPHPRHSTPKG